jgi:hypothetical protein
VVRGLCHVEVEIQRRIKQINFFLLKPHFIGNLYIYTFIIKARRMRWPGHVARMGEKWNAYRLLVRKPEGRRPLGRARRRRVDNIVEAGRGDVNWIGMAQDRDRWRALVNSVLNLRVP